MKKKLLLIVPKFFSYENEIKKQLESLGYNVLMIYENINEISIKCKFAIKVKNQKEKYFDNYYLKKLKNKKVDIVLAIRSSSLSINVINYIRKNSPKAKLYLYQWDSVNNNPNVLNIANLFDKVSTFDYEDARKYNWNYRPLFYINSTKRKNERKIDISYIGSLHSQRLKVYQELKKYKNLKKYIYIYSKLLHFIKEKYIKRNLDFSKCSVKDIKFKSLSLKKTNKIMSNSNIILDYTHPRQTGFTMRTCEAIGHRCKLVTNNKKILNADFYNPNNIYIYDIDNFNIPNSFLNTKFTEIPLEVYNNYSIKNWVKELIDYE